ncbi:glucose-1-phosphate adenylyltransferase [bacterium]|nr:glucose-1-phosphate adenylyltransferase [bacterium]
MRRTLTVILGGGAGSRLFPLTKYRAKPAVPLAGKYRLIDVAISNSINSNLRQIFVLTQYLSGSLNRHVAQTYTFDIFSRGFVEILAAEQREEGGRWYQGTADAIRQQWQTLRDFTDIDQFLVLPGDALYHMDYRPLIKQHRESGAEITIAVNTIERKNAHHFGLMALAPDTTVTEFREKPKGDAMNGIEAPAQMLKEFGSDSPPGDTFLASMGVYVFNRDVLERYLVQTDHVDFGKQIIPDAIENYRTQGFIFPGYWEDIGTIQAFFDAHMDLLKEPPAFSFSNPHRPIFTRPRFLPNINITRCDIGRARIAEGSNIEGATINNSIIGLRTRVQEGALIEDSIVMGGDWYEPRDLDGKMTLGVGPDSVIKRCIVDKNARIGRGVKLINEKGLQEAEGDNYIIRDGIIIIPKGVTIPDGTVI